MQISVRNPEYDQETTQKITRAHKKRCSAEFRLENKNKDIQVIVSASNRVVGKFLFVRDDGNFILEKKNIIEAEFQPLEYAIYSLVLFSNKKRIRGVCVL